jgi:hypothetical protein
MAEQLKSLLRSLLVGGGSALGTYLVTKASSLPFRWRRSRRRSTTPRSPALL